MWTFIRRCWQRVARELHGRNISYQDASADRRGSGRPMSTGYRRCAWIALALALHLAPAIRDGWHSGGAPRVEFAIRDALPRRAVVESPMCREEFVMSQVMTAFSHVSSL